MEITLRKLEELEVRMAEAVEEVEEERRRQMEGQQRLWADLEVEGMGVMVIIILLGVVAVVHRRICMYYRPLVYMLDCLAVWEEEEEEAVMGHRELAELGPLGSLRLLRRWGTESVVLELPVQMEHGLAVLAARAVMAAGRLGWWC